MQIALFGGAFDPPHRGHKKVVQSLIEAELVDQVWLVPVFKHPWADRLGKIEMSSYQDRLQMAQLVTTDQIKVAEYRDVSFTYPTLKFFSEQYPEYDFHWVMGSEYLPKFEDFLAGHPGLKKYHFFIYPRFGYPLEPIYGNMTALESMEEIEISSTMVRQAVKQGKDIVNLTTEQVREYIDQHNLYTS